MVRNYDGLSLPPCLLTGQVPARRGHNPPPAPGRSSDGPRVTRPAPPPRRYAGKRLLEKPAGSLPFRISKPCHGRRHFSKRQFLVEGLLAWHGKEGDGVHRQLLQQREDNAFAHPMPLKGG